MNEENMLAHLFRALSGKSQEQFGDDNQIDAGDIAKIERGHGRAWRGWLERMAASIQLTVEEGKELLRQARACQRRRQRQGRGTDDLFARLGESTASRARLFYQRLLRARLPEAPPGPEDRRLAREQAAFLKKLEPDARKAVLQGLREVKFWAVSEAASDSSVEAASQDPRETMEWAELAVELAEQVTPEAWQRKVKGFAAGHLANALKVYGRLKEADVALEKAKPLWEAGSDPRQLLDPGRLFDIEASLRRAQRRFQESLIMSKKAIAVSRYPARALILKATTLHVMSDYEGAVEALLEAEPKIDPTADPRLWYQQRFNLATNYSLIEQYAEAEKLIKPVRAVAGELGDEIFLHRVTWIEGRLAAGLGTTEEALRLLDRARQEFEHLDMGYDVALAVLESSELLLREGRTAEVKALTPALAKVFKSQEVHREALAALLLFQEAVEREEATAELARRVLSFLFRARYDEGLKFSS